MKKVLVKDIPKNEIIEVVVSLDDECKNGHQDFSVTGTIWEKKRGREHGYITGGCIHDEILKYFPDLEIFVKLHSCDFDGVPMHAVSNMFFHLKNESHKMTKEKFCEYYRCNSDQFESFRATENEIHFASVLIDSGLIESWKSEATAAIEKLEKMTGEKFVNTSSRSQLRLPSNAEIEDVKRKIATGFFTPESIEKRRVESEKKRFDSMVEKIENDCGNEIKKAELEKSVKLAILNGAGFRALENHIFYAHTKTVKFNWRGYDSLPAELVESFKKSIVLPDGVHFE